MATPSPPGRRSTGDKKTPSSSSIITRNGARKAKIQTRAMSAGAKPSAVVVAAKKKAQLKKKHQGDTLVRDYLQIAMDSKFKVRGPTGFVTEPRMVEHRCLWDDKYPESPQRLMSVIDRCNELQLIEQCVLLSPRAASKEELNVLHSPSVFELLETTHQNHELAYLEEVSSRYDAIYIHPRTHELALISAGSTIDMVDRIVTGEIQNGFAAVRPPGHHAMYSEPCGYCFYNNVALAAKHAIDKHGLSRVLIVDWDVHHGQATQQMFYDDPRVVYFSIHRYEHGAFWPNLKQSNFHYTGYGEGEGYTFNVPLNKTGMKDADYLAIWHQLLIPMALEYQPELILVSAGYDAAVGCPEFAPQLIIVSAGYDSAIGDEKGEMLISPACYATLLHQLECVRAAVCVVLEGGYFVSSLAEGAALTLRTLLGYPPPHIEDIGEPSDSIRESILNCIYTHKKFWRCYNFQPTYSIDTTIPNVSDVDKEKHTVVVEWKGDETVPERFKTRDCYPVQSETIINEKLALLNQMIRDTDLSTPKHPVCYVYDERMLKHKNICEPGHVECPERIMRVHERHRDYGLLQRVQQLPAREATSEEILAVHNGKHLNKLTELATTKLRDLNNQKDEYDSVYFHPDSLESASVAAGSVMQMVDAVLSKEAGCGVCVVRPPGHHADQGTPSGFCLLNNVAIAAQYALDNHDVHRVLILDWDVHHGNGTQRITYESDQILYLSIHRYDNGAFFPHSKEGDYTAVGAGRGKGYNVNIPWNVRGCGDTEYLAAMTQVVLPIAYEFRPQLVLVSAGFDAVVGDPLGGCKVTPECFGQMTKMLRGLASGRVIVCLEGGYNVTNVSYSMTLCTKALLGDPTIRNYEPKPTCNPSAVESINNVIKVHKKYWKSLKFQVALPIEDVIEKPGPSRGLITADMGDLGKLRSLSISDAANECQSKTAEISNEIEAALEQGIANLSIAKPKSGNSLNCGSDDQSQSNFKEDSKMNYLLEGSNSNEQKGPNIERIDLGGVGPSSNEAESSLDIGEQIINRTGSSSETGEQSFDRAGSNSETDEQGTDRVGPRSETVEQGTDRVGLSSGTDAQDSDGAGPSSGAGAQDSDRAGPNSGAGTQDSDRAGPSSGAGAQDSDRAGSSSGAGTQDSDRAGPSSRAGVQVSDRAGPSSGAGTRGFDRAGPSSGAVARGFDRAGPSSIIHNPSRNGFNPLVFCRRRFDRGLLGSADDPTTVAQVLAHNMGCFIRHDTYAVVPQSWCPHIDGVQDVPDGLQIVQGAPCVDCFRVIENWVCLHCYMVYCSRYAYKHLQRHFHISGHAVALSLSDLSVWCSQCEVYLDHERLYSALNNAHRNKFGVDMPRRTITLE